jgi:hypothetical protein
MQLFTLKEATRFLKIPLSELRALVATGEISYVEVNGRLRLRCDHLIRFIRENTKQAQSEWLHQDDAPKGTRS